MTSTVVKNTTALTASGPNTDVSGTAITASAISSTLSGGTSGATGTITYTVFGPQSTAPTSCTGGGTTVGTATVAGNGSYIPSAGFTPSSAGTYWWYASYNGDGNNSSSSSTCGSGMASTTVYSVSSAASVTSTTASSSATTTSFAVQPSTTYLLLVFRHSASGDGITSISSSGLSPALSLSSFTSITSQNYNTATTYQWAYWVTTDAAASGTGTLTINFTKTLGAGQITIVDLVAVGGNNTTNPVLTGNESLSTGSSATATANLTYAPGSVDSSLVFLTGANKMTATAPTGTPSMSNVFYSQQSAGSTGVYYETPGTQNESFSISTSQAWGTMALEIRRAGSTNSPTLSVGAPSTGTAGTAISVGSLSATLSGASSGATNGITYTVFGPQASAPTDCTTGGTTVGSAVSVAGNGTYNPTAGFTPSQAGTYWWYADYSGDQDDRHTTSTCGSGMPSTAVGAATTTLTMSTPASGLANTAISASSISATLAGGVSTPGGTITYTVFGPQASAPTNCTSGGTTVGTATASGNGSYSSNASFTPTSAGTYWWYASYAGDANNSSSASTCGSGMAATYVYSASSVASVSSTTAANTATTTSFTVQPSTTYLLLVFRHSTASDSISSISSTGLSPALSTSSFTAINSQTYNSVEYQWAYWITTSSSASGTGTLTVNFANTLGSGQVTVMDLIQLGGVSPTAPVVTANEIKSSASSATATANLPSALTSGDAVLMYLSSSKGLGSTTPAPNPAMTNIFYSQQGPGTLAPYIAAPGAQNESTTVTSAFWGTLGFELTHP
jgi:hypothetical protein